MPIITTFTIYSSVSIIDNSFDRSIIYLKLFLNKKIFKDLTLNKAKNSNDWWQFHINAQVKDKRDEYSFLIVNFPFLDICIILTLS
jgi:hypothetical protein